MEKQALGSPVTKQVVAMKEVVLCDNCSPRATKKSGSGPCRVGNLGEWDPDSEKNESATQG